MKYHEVLEAGDGGMLAREAWIEGRFIYKQIPIVISLDIIPKMISVPSSVKKHLLDKGLTLKFRCQFVDVDIEGNVDSYYATNADLLTSDWYIKTD